MEIADLAGVDWSTPWLAPLADIGRAVGVQTDWRGELTRVAQARGAHNQSGHRIVFADADAAFGMPYEAFIARTGCVPTRANLHDFFNALIFVEFPKTKARLNHLQSAAIEREGVGAKRGPVRDAATLIDESAILLVTQQNDLIEAIREHDWSAVFLQQRDAWDEPRVARSFGHALLEKLVRPYKAITAHALHVPLASDASTGEVDAYLAATLDEELSPRLLMPLPVLGIPGWCAENTDPDFYRDAKVFRPAKMRRPMNPGESIE